MDNISILFIDKLILPYTLSIELQQQQLQPENLMHKLIERIGTQAQKFNFVFTVATMKTKHTTKDCYRVCLKREDKVFYSSYFKVEPNKLTELKETVKFSATMFYDKKAQEYHSKMFEFILLRCDKNQECEEARHQVDLEEVIINYHIRKTFEDRFSVLEVDISGQGAKQSLSPVRKSCPATQNKSYNTISSIEKNFVNGQTKQPVEYPKKNQPIELIRFDDDTIGSETPIRNTVEGIRTGLISSSKEKQVSFKNVIMQDENRSKEKDRRREERRKSRQYMSNKNNSTSTLSYKTESQTPPARKLIINQPMSMQTNLQQKLYQIENQLGEERMRKSSLYENMSHEKDETINKLKVENSELHASVSRFMNQLEFANKQIKNMEGRYEKLYKKMNKLVEEHRQLKQQKERLANENAELISTLSVMKNNNQNGGKVSPTNARSVKEIKNQLQGRNQIEIQKLSKQIEKYKRSNKRLDEEVQGLEAEKLLVESKYQQMLKKYKMISGQLSNERIRGEEMKRKMELNERDHFNLIKKKEQEIIEARRYSKQLEMKLMKPTTDQLNKKEHELLKQRLDKLVVKMEEDTRENKELEIFLKKEIQKYKKENLMLYEKMNIIEKSYNDEMNISMNREKSLNKALAEKDRKLAQQSKEFGKMKQILAENNKFIETEKVDLIMKMRVLNEELTKRKEVSEELEQAEYKNRELENRIRMLTSENQEAKVELERLQLEVELSEKKFKDHNSALSLVQQLQGQLVKVNMKMATTMQMIFQNDPGLAQTIIQNLRQP